MIVKIDKDGLLIVQAETPLESYALKCWNKDTPHVYMIEPEVNNASDRDQN